MVYDLRSDGFSHQGEAFRGWNRDADFGSAPLFDNVAVNGDAAVGANHGAQSAASAIVFGIQKYDGPVTLVVQLIGHSQNIRRTGLAT